MKFSLSTALNSAKRLNSSCCSAGKGFGFDFKNYRTSSCYRYIVASTRLPAFEGYASKSVVYKKVDGLEITLDVLWPTTKPSGPVPVLIHYHGGFLILGDRYAFLPHWLINAAVARGWIFVTPDYRLLPETTAHSSLDDVIDAYNWVVKFLHTELKVERGSVAVAGSSAGGWLALGTACFANPKPDALVSIYGMLDFSHDRYTTQGDSIFHAPVTDTTPTLERLKQIRQQTKPQVTTGSELPEALFRDPRFAFITTLHIERLYPDYLTGVPGLREAVVTQGLQAIPQQHRRLFPAEFGFHHGLPPVFLLHGKNDSAVPCSLSERTAARLRDAGVKVEIAFPEDAEHGFDGRSGIKDVDTEGERDEYKTPAIQSLKTVIHFLEQHLQ